MQVLRETIEPQLKISLDNLNKASLETIMEVDFMLIFHLRQIFRGYCAEYEFTVYFVHLIVRFVVE